ncbi:MAG: sodium:solute symporter [Clostridiaceae bacterium]|nr:sodium:solute symporter [Clostridiaceae bacterium]
MLKYVILGAFLLLMILVGILSSRKVKTADDYVLGGRRMGSWLSAFSYGTTYFSAVVFVGYAGRFGWSYGISATWIGIGNAVIGSTLAWLLLGERTRRISQAMKTTTMAEFFRKRYDSPGLEKFSAIIIFIFLIPYSASVYQGLGYILQSFFKGTFLADTRWSMLLVAVITAAYLYFGGYISTAVNSVIQGLIMFFGVIYMVVKVVNMIGGLPAGLSGLAAVSAEGLQQGALASWAGPAPFDLIVLILMTSLGTFGLPQMISKFNGIRDRKATWRAMIMSTVFALVIGGGAYFMGGFSRLFNEKMQLGFNPQNLDTLMPVVFEAILSPEMMAVLVILMLSASMSTLAAVVLVSAPTFSKTILKSNSILLMRIMSILFVLISYLVAIIPSAIVVLMSFSWGAVSGAFVGPYLWGLYMKKMTKAGATAGMVGGLSTVVIGAAIVIIGKSSTAIWAPRLAVLAILISFIITPLVSLATQRCSKIPEGAKFV